MFFTKKQDTTPSIVPPVVAAKPLAKLLPPATYSEDTEYKALAEKMGLRIPQFEPSFALAAEVQNFLTSSKIPVYDLEEVNQYMKKEAEKNKRGWGWALLATDNDPGEFFQTTEGRTSFYNNEIDAYMSHAVTLTFGGTTNVRYSKPIPKEILQTAAIIRDKFPEKLGFYVSDYAVAKPDPFILCHIRGSRHVEHNFVFGFWDEPGFTVKK